MNRPVQAVLCLGCLILAGTTVSFMVRRPQPALAVSSIEPEIAPVNVTQTMTPGACFHIVASEVGISPGSLAAAGLSTSAATILGAIAQQQALCTALMAARGELSQATEARVLAESNLRTNPSDAESIAALNAANLDVAAANAATSTALTALRQSVLNGVAEADIAQLDAYRASLAFEVEPAMRVVNRTTDEWQAIAIALIAERRAQHLGRPLDSERAAMLASVRAEPAVVQAQSELNASLAAITALYAQHASAGGVE